MKPHDCPKPKGFSLIEMLIVITVMGIIAAMAIPNGASSLPTELDATARVCVAELDYARSLAITYGSTYQAGAAAGGTQLVIEHSGSNSALDALPPGPFRQGGDDEQQHIFRLDELAGITSAVRIARIAAESELGQTAVNYVEFGPLGETTRAEPTTIWLVAGADAARRYLPIEINPITGLAAVGDLTATPPAVVTSEAEDD